MRARRAVGWVAASVLGWSALTAAPALAEEAAPDQEDQVVLVEPVPAEDAPPTPSPDQPVDDQTADRDQSVAAPDEAGDEAQPSGGTEPGSTADGAAPSDPGASAVPGDPGVTALPQPVPSAGAEEPVTDRPTEAPAVEEPATDGPERALEDPLAADAELAPEATPLAVGDVSLRTLVVGCVDSGAPADVLVEARHLGEDQWSGELTLRTGGVVLQSQDLGVTGGVAEVVVNPGEVGEHEIALTLTGEREPSAVLRVSVPPCLSVLQTCDSVVFTNPSDALTARLTYLDEEDPTGEPYLVDLEPGEQHTAVGEWLEWTAEALGSPSVRLGGGLAGVTYEACADEFFLLASTCSPAGAAGGVLGVGVAAGDETGTWRVLDADGRTVAEGDVDDLAADDDFGFLVGEVTGLSPGGYTLQSLDGDEVLSSEGVVVLSCVDVEVRCTTATLTNPATNPALVAGFVEYLTLEDVAAVELAPGVTEVVDLSAALEQPITQLFAYAYPLTTADEPDDLASALAEPFLVVGEDCDEPAPSPIPTPGAVGTPDVVPGDEDPTVDPDEALPVVEGGSDDGPRDGAAGAGAALAETGGPGVLVAVVGALMVTVGAGALARRRSRSR